MKKTFLLITPFLPYNKCPHAGGQFIFKILSLLSCTYKITLVTRIEPKQKQFLNDIKKYCNNIYTYEYKTPISKTFTNKLSIIYSYFMLVKLAGRIIKDNSFDFIQIEFIETGLFYFYRSSAKLIVNAHDLISIVVKRKFKLASCFKKLIMTPKYLIIILIEKLVIYKADLVWVRSNSDKLYLMKGTFNKSIGVFPIPISNKSNIYMKEKKEYPSLLFVGALNRKLNVDASIYIINNILPKLREDYPEIRLVLAGNAPSEELKCLANDNQNIEITGFVDDLANVYQKAFIFVSPIFVGGGTIYKNLEAFSYGVPVITTDIGNYGIEARSNIEILIANNSNEFVEKIKILLHNEELYKKLEQNGKEFVRKNFDESLIISNVVKDLNNLCGVQNES
tara:strand:+ start:659 stop:1840 length:1182 start_codon:yes stop_codon:yes gene_type:complete